MDAAEPDLIGAAKARVEKRRPPLVERHGVKAVVDVGLRNLEPMKDVQGLVAEQRQAERVDDVPEPEEANRRSRRDDLAAAWFANAPALDDVAAIQRRRGAPAEADDVDGTVPGRCVRPALAQRIV